MFTGIVEEIGVVAELNPQDEAGGTTLTIQLPSGSTLLADCHQGDSIAINGTCLTVTSFSAAGGRFSVGVAPETQRLTNLGALAPGARVNLERAMRADTRMGGHMVQGHVDTVATIADRRPDGNAVVLRFAPRDRAVLRYVIHKGYIALDGTSLTITRVNDSEGWWEVMLVAYTQDRVVVAAKSIGDKVNVEVDMMAKYIEKSVQAYLGCPLLPGSEMDNMVAKIVAQGFGTPNS